MMRVMWAVVGLVVGLAGTATAQPAEYAVVLQQMEREGLFTRAKAGDDAAASYFVREFVWRVNPGCDPSKPGALRKGGGKNIDGYAEDAIALNANPADLRNVVDLVGGAGAPGARVVWGGPVQRRPEDVWECPKALGPREAAYIGLGGGSAPPPPDPLAAKVNELVAQIAALTAAIDGLRDLVSWQTTTLDVLVNQRLTEDWAARVWAATDPNRPSPTLPDFPAYKACGRFIGCITMEPIR